jgi:hypothetical protein
MRAGAPLINNNLPLGAVENASMFLFIIGLLIAAVGLLCMIIGIYLSIHKGIDCLFYGD